MGPFDLAIGAIALASFILMARNMMASPDRLPLPRRQRGEAGPAIYVGPLPDRSPDPGMGARIAAIIRQAGVDATIAYTLVRADKPALVKRLEREIERVRLAYESTGSPRYQERLRVLERMYLDVVRSARPYTGGTVLIVWGGPGEVDARTVKTLIEAETGLELREYKGTIEEALQEAKSLVASGEPSLALPWIERPGERSIVLGVDPDYGALVALEWPRDFETHVGIIGPTGKGKTVLLLGLVSQLASPELEDRPSIVVIDPKGDLAGLVPRAVPDARAARSPLEAASRACAARGTIVLGPGPADQGAEAVRALLDCYVSGRAGHRTVLVVDEAWRYLGEAEAYIEASVRQGRSLGLHIVYSTQSFDDISSIVAENTGTLIVFGGTAESYKRKAESLGIPGSMLDVLPVGTAVVRRGERTVKTRIFNFQAYVEPAERTA